MTDKEKVIKHIADCINAVDGLTNVQWVLAELDILKDALALLKAQEPRVMTLEEARTALHNDSIIWVELKDKLIAAGVRMDETDYFLMQNDDVLNIDDLDWEGMENEYGKCVRVWIAEPSEEQRKTTSWN